MNLAQNIVALSIVPKSFNPPSIEEILFECNKVGLPEREGERMFAYYDSCGWTIGKHRKPVVSWRGCLRTWKLNWEDNRQVASKPSASVESMLNQKHLARVEDRLKFLKGQMPLTSNALKQEWIDLRHEKIRLMCALGWKA